MRKHPIAEFMDAEGIISQAQAADVLGLRQQEVSDYINWRHVPRPKKLNKLALRLNVPRERFLPDHELELEAPTGDEPHVPKAVAS